MKYKKIWVAGSLILLSLSGNYKSTQAEELGNIVIDYDETSEFYNKAISADGKEIKVRAIPDYSGAVIGKMEADTIVDIQLVNGDWTAIKSSDIEGYVRTSSIIRGYDLEDYVDKHNKKFKTRGVIIKSRARIYKTKELKGKSAGIIKENEEVEVIRYNNTVAEIKAGKKKGFIRKDTIEVNVKFRGIGEIWNDEEDLSNIDKYTSEYVDEPDTPDTDIPASSDESSNDYIPEPNNSSDTGISDNDLRSLLSDEEKEKAYEYIPEDETQMRREVLLYAVKFLGNPYVYGGESLTNGIDCSAYVQACYRHIGISIGRTSRQQPSYGKQIDIKDIRPGDLLFYYKYGTTIGHVTMYLGNGKVIHASNPTDGIKISDITYRTPCMVVDIISQYDKEEDTLELE